MRLVIVSTLGAVHRYVVAEVLRAFSGDGAAEAGTGALFRAAASARSSLLVLQPMSMRGSPAPLPERLARWRESPLEKLSQGVNQRVRRARMERAEVELERLLFAGAPPAVDASPVSVADLHAPATLERVRAFAPDVMLVSGAPVLRPELFTIPRRGAVNLHFGVAPFYRGEDTLFWPLVKGDFDHLGVTLHALDRGVDTGHVLAHGFPERRGGETETEMWAACARLGARLVTSFLAAPESASESAPPRPDAPPPPEVPSRPEAPRTGRQFFRRERTALSEARYWALRAAGRTPPPARERIVVYSRHPAADSFR